MNDIRRFCLEGGVELRAAEDGAAQGIVGYAAIFNVWSPVYRWAGFRERIDPHFFDRVLSEGTDTLGEFNHSDNYVLGRTTSGTMRLLADTRGLRYDIDISASAFVRDLVIVPIQRRDVRGSSFSFLLPDAGGDYWVLGADGVLERTLVTCERLIDVGPVSRPWYPETEADLRAVGGRPEEPAEALRKFLSIEAGAELRGQLSDAKSPLDSPAARAAIAALERPQPGGLSDADLALRSLLLSA